MTLARTVAAGLAGGAALNAMMLLTFRLLGFGWNGGGLLLDPVRQSDKLIAVWTRLEPLPLVAVRPAPIIIGLLAFGICHAFMYRWLAPAWPAGVGSRAVRIGLLVFVLSFLFWEFFTPFNLFGEPWPLISLEIIFWLLIAAAEAWAIAWCMEHR